MEENFNPYKVLGVTPYTDQREIKRVYKAFVRRCHPDKNKTQDDEEFKKVQQAYEILMDPAKKDALDKKVKLVKTANRRVTHLISIERAYYGGKELVKYKRKKMCGECMGVGKCEPCKTSGYIIEDKSIEIDIKPGFSYNMTIIPDEGDHERGMEPGDLIVVIAIRNTHYLYLDGVNIHMTVELSLREILFGFHIEMKWFNGETITLENVKTSSDHKHSITWPGTKKVFKGFGFPYDLYSVDKKRRLEKEEDTKVNGTTSGASIAYGDLIVYFDKGFVLEEFNTESYQEIINQVKYQKPIYSVLEPSDMPRVFDPKEHKVCKKYWSDYFKCIIQ